jgi:hypothetical protein
MFCCFCYYIHFRFVHLSGKAFLMWLNIFSVHGALIPLPLSKGLLYIFLLRVWTHEKRFTTEVNKAKMYIITKAAEHRLLSWCYRLSTRFQDCHMVCDNTASYYHGNLLKIDMEVKNVELMQGRIHEYRYTNLELMLNVHLLTYN